MVKPKAMQTQTEPKSIDVLIQTRRENSLIQPLYEAKEYKIFYKTVDVNEGHRCMYPTRLDTYGCGCPHDCLYCYAKSQLEFRKLWDPNNPRVADIKKIEKKIQKITPGSIVRLGGMLIPQVVARIKRLISFNANTNTA